MATSDEKFDEIYVLMGFSNRICACSRKEAMQCFGIIPFNCVHASTEQGTSFMANSATTVHMGVSGFPCVQGVMFKRVFLFAVVQPNGLPILDFLTNELEAHNIANCLRSGTRFIIKMKKKFKLNYVIVDWNFDVIAGACCGLTENYRFRDFLKECYEHMVNGKKQQNKSSIQVCRVQLMEAMKRRLEGQSFKVRTVATRLFYRLSECTSLREAEEWFRHVIILFTSKYASSQVDASLNATSTCSDPVTSTVSHTKPDSDADKSDEWAECVEESPFCTHFAQIRIEQEKLFERSELKSLNRLCSPSVLTHFEYFIPIFPVWCRYLVPANVPLINAPLERRLNYVTTELFAGQRNLPIIQVIQTLIADNKKIIDTSNLCFRESGVSLNLPPSRADRARGSARGSPLAAKNGNGSGR